MGMKTDTQEFWGDEIVLRRRSLETGNSVQTFGYKRKIVKLFPVNAPLVMAGRCDIYVHYFPSLLPATTE